jgi:hypothetical protein
MSYLNNPSSIYPSTYPLSPAFHSIDSLNHSTLLTYILVSVLSPSPQKPAQSQSSPVQAHRGDCVPSGDLASHQLLSKHVKVEQTTSAKWDRPVQTPHKLQTTVTVADVPEPVAAASTTLTGNIVRPIPSHESTAMLAGQRVTQSPFIPFCQEKLSPLWKAEGHFATTNSMRVLFSPSYTSADRCP